MIKATCHDKSLVVSILSASFDSNKSVNYVAPQDSKRKERIKALMSYAFEICNMYGAVYLSEDKTACALILYPEKKVFGIKGLLLNLELAINCIGIFRIGKILKREAQIKLHHPGSLYSYLWFLGVDPAYQNKGTGSKLLSEIIELSTKENRDIYLETSTIANISWYEKSGFETISKLDVGYPLFVMKRKINYES